VGLVQAHDRGPAGAFEQRVGIRADRVLTAKEQPSGNATVERDLVDSAVARSSVGPRHPRRA